MGQTIPITQKKFSNGEISRSMYGDTLHPKYAASLKTCLNWIPTPQGALVKRPGTQFIGAVKDANYAPRLVPFVFTDAQAFVLEVGNLYMRFYQRGRYVGVDGALHTYGDSYVGGYYELVTIFTTAMLPYLKFRQVGDVVTITYGGQVSGVAAVAPQDLRHTGGALTPWTIAAAPTKIPITTVPMALSVSIGAWNAVSVYKLGDLSTQNNVLWASIQSNNTGAGSTPPAVALNAAQTGLQGNFFWTPAVDPAHPAVTVDWVATFTAQDPTGTVFESGPSAVLTGTGPLSSDRKVPLSFNGITVALPAGWAGLTMRLYRGPTGGIRGFVAEYAFSTAPFIVEDQGIAPDFTRQPPKNTDPFLINGADSYPSVIGYLDQRRLWSGSALLPSMILLSKLGDFYNYDSRNIPGSDTDAFNILLASEVLEQVRSFVPMRRGLIMTGQGEWAVAGAGGAPISRSNNDPKRQSKWGSSWLDPIVIGTGVLFNTAKSNMVRDLYPLYGLYSDIWDGQDLSVMARHLLDQHTIRDWAFQSVPYPVIWATRDDGVMLSLTYQHAPPSFGQQLAEGTVAWAQHTTGLPVSSGAWVTIINAFSSLSPNAFSAAGPDKFESICSVPEPPEDAVYVSVLRSRGVGSWSRFIERFGSSVCSASPYSPGNPDVRYGAFSDGWVGYDGHNEQIGFSGINVTIDSRTNPGSVNPVDYAVGSLIRINVGVVGPFTPADAGNSGFVFDPENLVGCYAKAHIVLYSGVNWQVTAELDTALTAAQIVTLRAGIYRWALAKNTITAGNLNGAVLDSGDPAGTRGVVCIADGDVAIPTVWAAGVATLQVPAVVIKIGLSYNSDVALLDATHAQAEIRNRLKNVVRIGFEVADARDMWFGKDFVNLTQWKQRQVRDAYGVIQLQTGYFEDFVTGEWNKGAQGVLRHFTPLPATISSVLREVSLGGT